MKNEGNTLSAIRLYLILVDLEVGNDIFIVVFPGNHGLLRRLRETLFRVFSCW